MINTSADGVVPRVLVVGGAGYIGSHMLLILQEAGWNVMVFDNFRVGLLRDWAVFHL